MDKFPDEEPSEIDTKDKETNKFTARTILDGKQDATKKKENNGIVSVDSKK